MTTLRLPLLPVLLLTAVLLAPGASAQGETRFLYDFVLTGPQETIEVPWQGSAGTATAVVTFQDLSRDSPTALQPGIPGEAQFFPHSVTFRVEPILEDTAGWTIIVPPAGFTSYAHSPPQDVPFTVAAIQQATNPYYKVRFTAFMETPDGVVNKSLDILFYSKGIKGFALNMGPRAELAPREVGGLSFSVTNGGLFRKSYDFAVESNPCGLSIGLPATTVAEPKQTVRVQFSVAAPEDKFWYRTENCGLLMAVYETDNPDLSRQTIPLGVLVNGFYLDPTWVFWTLAAALAIFLLILLMRRVKERVEEEILQKPQKPWLIPVERVYLERLKRKDPRAWYVVRHYLMEDEYRSSLLWHKSYKAATKGDRKKERLILRHERNYDKWQAKWKRRLAKPLKAADRYEAKLQRKLDRKSRKATKRDRRKWEKEVGLLEQAHAKRLSRAEERHAKAVARGQRKGQPEPVMPVVESPDLPSAPQPRSLRLAEHRWSRKAARHRARMERRQGDLEVRFEKADARYQARLRARVQRIARKLDDPTFVAEHPMLRGADP